MLIYVKVKTNAGKQEVINLEDNRYLVSLFSSPQNNKANMELIKTLSKFFNVSQKKIFIKRGLSSKEKIVEIKDEI
ncbi:MAG: DUF167 domain-containing protein [Candidatus Pacearchaeota archaeon]